jgi:hypothetical protein
MIRKVSKEQFRFYETVKDEFRSYDDVNKEENTTVTADPTSNPNTNPADNVSIDSEAEYMKQCSVNRAAKVDKSCAKTKKESNIVNRLFKSENPKVVTKFQKVSKLVKDF